MSPNDADGMANSVDPDQTAPLGISQAYLSENLGSLRYTSHVVTMYKNIIDKTDGIKCRIFRTKPKYRHEIKF